jgi:hypothetical protein
MRKSVETFLTAALSVLFGMVPILLGTTNIVVLSLFSGVGAVIGLLIVNYSSKENHLKSGDDVLGDNTYKNKLEFLFSLRILTAFLTLVVFVIVYNYFNATSEFVFGKIYNFTKHFFYPETENTTFDPLFQNETLRHFVHLSYAMLFAILVNLICNVILDVNRKRVDGYNASYHKIIYTPFQTLLLYSYYTFMFLGPLGLLSYAINLKDIPLNVYTYLYGVPLFALHIATLHSDYKEMRKNIREKFKDKNRFS